VEIRDTVLVEDTNACAKPPERYLGTPKGEDVWVDLRQVDCDIEKWVEAVKYRVQ
jgi:hypothetical protein